jgi:eukaryotic-like serine/threonine-protein kinase
MGDSVLGGRYRLRDSLGGTMGQVFLAEDMELGRDVVVKLLGPDAERARFEREARAAATLAHENIVRIYAYGEAEDGRPYMVFEHLSGGSLEERLAGGGLPDAETLRVARDVAAGLAHAHANGLVHRDLKPANILFDGEGRAKISDFGIARLGDSGTLTEAGTVLGTAAYISPEQGAGQPATPASDVYSFGVVLFRMLTGRLPFEADQPLELVRMHRFEPPPSVSDFRPNVPARLESLVAATLAKDPRERPPDGGALFAELEVPAGEPTTALPLPPAAARDKRLRLAIAGVVLALLAASGVALALIATHGGSTTTSTSEPISTHKAQTHTSATSPPPTQATTATTATTAKTATTATTAATEPTTAPATETQPPTTTEPPVTTAPTTVETLPTTVASTPVTLPGG